MVDGNVWRLIYPRSRYQTYSPSWDQLETALYNITPFLNNPAGESCGKLSLSVAPGTVTINGIFRNAFWCNTLKVLFAFGKGPCKWSGIPLAVI